jgi:hypothetical protein
VNGCWTAAASAQTAQSDTEQKAGAQGWAVVFCSGMIVNQALPQVTAAFDNQSARKKAIGQSINLSGKPLQLQRSWHPKYQGPPHILAKTIGHDASEFSAMPPAAGCGSCIACRAVMCSYNETSIMK